MLDETDSGLDIDALKIVAEGVNRFRAQEGKGVLLITHYTRILRYIEPDFVHVFVAGRIAEQGGPELAEQLEAEGYDKYVKAAAVLTGDSKGDLMEGLLPDLDVVRKDFPILSRVLGRTGSRWSTSTRANTSQKPQVVIDTMVDHLERHNANIARAMHQLGAEATAAYEDARDKVAAFLGAPDRDEVIFTKNASEALNLAANTLAWPGERQVGPGDEVVITEMEHHSNIVPWQLLCERTGATLRWFGLTDDGQLDLSNVDDLITERTKVVSLVWVSNMLGTDQPDRRDRAPRPRGRRARGRRRLAGGAAAADRPRGDARGRASRPAGLHRPQGGRPDRHRRALGPPGACSTSCRRSSVVAR